MGAWIRRKKNEGILAALFGTSVWTYSPWLEGDENPNLPPPELASQAVRGPAYRSSDGHVYRTWRIPAFRGSGINDIVDWREKLDITKGDPNSVEITKWQ